MNIDWSKAPEDATHYNPGNKMFYCFSRGNYYFYALNNVDLVFGGSPEDYRDSILIGRPKKQEAWNGEGLPPVGTVCEYKKKDSNYRQGFVSVSVLFYGREKCLLLHSASSNEFVEDISSVEFRPIKTVEQLAEEEKKKVIDDMQRIYEESMLDYSSRLGHASRPAIKALYEAGYRKQ